MSNLLSVREFDKYKEPVTGPPMFVSMTTWKGMWIVHELYVRSNGEMVTEIKFRKTFIREVNDAYVSSSNSESELIKRERHITTKGILRIA